MEEFLGYHAAGKADEYRAGGERGKFAATFRSLGGEGDGLGTYANALW
jgi:hypothetical protein